MALEWFWIPVGIAVAIILILLVLLCRRLGRRARVNIVDEKGEDSNQLGRLAAPAIVPNGGKHPAGTPIVIVPSESAGVYARIGRPTEIQNEKFKNYDGQTICLGQPNQAGVIREGDEKLWRVGTFIIQAFSYAPGRVDSEVATVMVEVVPPTGEVFFSHSAGCYDSPFELVLFHPDTSNILFTYSEGSHPAENPWECGIPYTHPIPITSTCEVRAAVQGSRTPAAAKRFTIPEVIPPPGIFVSGSNCASQSIAVFPGDPITFGSVYGATLLYSMRRIGKCDPSSVATQPSCVYTNALVATPGAWEIITLAQKSDWKDSTESFIRVLCAPEMPRVDPSTVSGMAPHTVRLLCNGSSDYYTANVIIQYHVVVNGEILEGTSEPFANSCELTLPSGHYILNATCFDLDTDLRSREVVREISVGEVKKKKLSPCTIHPNGGEHIVGEDPLMVVINSGDVGEGDLICEIEIRQPDKKITKTITAPIGEEVSIPLLGRLKVAAVVISPDGTRSTPTFASFTAKPPAPKLSPKNGEFTSSSSLKVYLYKPVMNPIMDISDVNLVYELTKWHRGSSETTTMNNNPDAQPIPIGAAGRYQVTAYLEVDGVRSPECSGWYTVHSDPLSAPIPVFKPSRKYHSVGDNVEVSISTTDPLAKIFWSDGSDGEFKLYKTPISISQSTTMKSYSTQEGVRNSDIATQDYEFSGASPGGTRRPLLPPEIHPKERYIEGKNSIEVIISQPGVSFHEDAKILYSIDEGNEKVYNPDHEIILQRSDAKPNGDVYICAYIEVPGIGISGSTKKTYSFVDNSTPRQRGHTESIKKPVVTVHAHQLLVELRPNESIKHKNDIKILYTVDGSFPLTREGGSTRVLDSGKTIEIPRHGCTELRCLCIDTKNRLPPSRVISKTFSEGIGYLPVAVPTHSEIANQSDTNSNELQPPSLIAHARVVVLIATCSTPDSVIRYAFGDVNINSESSIFPSQGLQIVTSNPSTSFIRLAAFKNGVASGEVHQQFRHVPGTEPERSEKHLNNDDDVKQQKQPVATQSVATAVSSAQTIPLPVQPPTVDTLTGSTLFPPASPLIFSTSSNIQKDTFSRGFANAKAKDSKRKSLLASLKKDDEARERRG